MKRKTCKITIGTLAAVMLAGAGYGIKESRAAAEAGAKDVGQNLQDQEAETGSEFDGTETETSVSGESLTLVRTNADKSPARFIILTKTAGL